MPPKKRLKQATQPRGVNTATLPDLEHLPPRRNSGERTLAEIHAHENDKRVRFVEDGHKYYVDGEEFYSVTQSIQKATGKPPFDADKAIERMLQSPAKLSPEYHGMSADEIKAEWENRRSCGTQMHACIEALLNGDPDVSAEDRKRFSIELSLLSKFMGAMRRHGWTIYRPEWTIFHPDTRLAGTIDAVFRREIPREDEAKEKDVKGGKMDEMDEDAATTPTCATPRYEYCIVDWKRVKTVSSVSKYKMGGCFAELDDCNYSKYVLQVLVYARILKLNYGIDVSIDEVRFCTFHPHKTDYMVYRAPLDKDGQRKFITAVDAFFEERALEVKCAKEKEKEKEEEKEEGEVH